METLLTLNNARVVCELLVFCLSRNFILEVRALWVAISSKTTASVASNDVPYERSAVTLTFYK